MTEPDLPAAPDPTELPIFSSVGRTLPGPTDLPIFGRSADTATSPVRPAPAAFRLAGPIDGSRTAPPIPPAPGVHGGNDAAPIVIDLFDRRTASSSARPTPARPGVIDWQFVAMLRSQAAEQLTRALAEERGQLDRETEHEIGRTIIEELLQADAAERLSASEETWSLDEQNQLAEAVFHALFGLGRLQPLDDDDSVENIIVTGSQNVWLDKTDGTLVKVDPVADSDEELLDFLAFINSRSEVNARPFSPAHPKLHMRLDGGSRLAVAAWTTPRPSVVIRRHRLVRVSLDDLVARNTMTPIQASFLRAAVRAGYSIVVAGPMGAGKTTAVRALCGAIPPWQSIGTFETEYELHLHELPDIHPIVHAWEARPGSGEVGADGRNSGEFTLDEALYDSFRFQLHRQIVGEVRGREAWAMIKAMESGTGSISTTHAKNAEAAIRKLVSCALEAVPQLGSAVVTSKIAECVDLVVQLHLETVPLADDTWRRSRWVSEILAVTPGEEKKGYATTHVFRPNPAGGPATPYLLPTEFSALEAYGFDLNGYLAESGTIEEEAR